MKRLLVAIVMIILLAGTAFSQTIPVESGIPVTMNDLDRPLLNKDSELSPVWRNSTRVDTLWLATSGTLDTSVAYVSFEQVAAIFYVAQANDSTDFKVYVYAGVCASTTSRTVVLVDSLDTSGNIDAADGFWKDGAGTYVWHHNVFLSTHFFYVFTTVAESGTDIKIYDSYVIRRRGR